MGTSTMGMVAGRRSGENATAAKADRAADLGLVSRSGAEEYPPHPLIGEGGGSETEIQTNCWAAA
jgi:hypothetical protein